MRFDFIIDGYNLMHAAGLARQRYAQGDLERCRTRLLSLVRHGLTSDQRVNTTVVFDGQNTEGFNESELRYHGMRIFYSSPGEEADDVIEELIAGHSFPKHLIIISSDHRLHKAGRVRRAQVIDSEQFLLQLERTQRRKSAGTEEDSPPQPEKPTDFDSDKWMEEFGEINFAEIDASLRNEEKRAEQIRKETLDRKIKRQPPQPISKPDEQLSEQNEEFQQFEESGQSENTPPLDIDFWEKRIAELDQEED